MLHVAVGTVGESLLPSACGVEFNEVAGYVLDLFLRLFLQPFPGTGAQGGEPRGRLSVLALVFRYLVERVDAHVHLVVVGVDDADDLLVALAGRLHVAVAVGLRRYGHAHQTSELADAEVHMHHVVAHFHLLKLFHGERYLAAAGRVGAQVVLVEAVENLVIGEEAELQLLVHESAVDGLVDGREGECCLLGAFFICRQGAVLAGKAFKDVVQPLLLLL